MLGLLSALPVRAIDSLLTWQNLSALKIYHLYSASDGLSHVEEMVLPSASSGFGSKLARR